MFILNLNRRRCQYAYIALKTVFEEKNRIGRCYRPEYNRKIISNNNHRPTSDAYRPVILYTNYDGYKVMFSFIIPTLGLSSMLDELVDLLDGEDIAGEIIIVLMIMHRLNYAVVPDDLKVWYGDDHLFRKQYYQNYSVLGSKLQGELALSSGKKEFDAIKEASQ